MSNNTQMGSGIHAGNLQEHLDSASNALQKGQSQYETPREFGEVICSMLPPRRATIVDLNCGSGQLLFAAANKTTTHLLGCDIDARQSKKQETDKLAVHRTVADLTKLYSLLEDVDWKADLFVLNPPWDLHWPKERLERLMVSNLSNVIAAYTAGDPRLGKDKIDSTVATLMIAMDRTTYRGEGLLIANNRTMDRLIFKPGAPYRALADRIWMRLIIKGNPMTGIEDCSFEKDQEFETCVLYFHHSHYGGCDTVIRANDTADLANQLRYISSDSKCQGSRIYSGYNENDKTADLWMAVRQEWEVQKGERPHYNIWLDGEGKVATHLSLYENTSHKFPKDEIERLHSLNGQRPMQLVMQMAQRIELKRAASGGIWRVHPDLPAAVERACREYDVIRAPLYPLSKIQRMGYLDEEKNVRCIKDLYRKDGSIAYKAGNIYELSSKTVYTERTKLKPSLSYGTEEFKLTGLELVIFITGEHERKCAFVDGRFLADESCSFGDERDREMEIEFTLQDLSDCFAIPEVGDVATAKPEAFQANLAALADIERIVNGELTVACL